MTRTEQNLVTLEHAALTIDGSLNELREEARQTRSRVQALALGAALLAPRRLRGIVGLVHMGLADEAHALSRGIIELAINLGWAGDDEERALRVQLRGPRDQKKFFERARDAGFVFTQDVFSALDQAIARMDPSGSLPDLPTLADRARQTRLFSMEQARDLYVMPYARHSAVVHADWVHVASVAEGKNLVGHLLHDTLAGTLFLVGGVAKAFHEHAKLAALCGELQERVRSNAVEDASG